MKEKKSAKNLEPTRVSVKLGDDDPQLKADFDELVGVGAEPSYLVREALRRVLPILRMEHSEKLERDAARLKKDHHAAQEARTPARRPHPAKN
jgi:hypothetical protein